ncbi:uncharacterized protein LOC128218338 [Mya arenaria]|uniref:uncharacterized protein LOC128218338 n=1 Tax=Mya arenaria TaxID=6604 RepID=UPI0022E61771|nr:uncharacterized protein LOC128218338 [Mya arenaria]
MAEVENTRRKHSVIPQLPLDKRYHVFVCYVQENVNDVRTIVGNLEKAGLKCCYHERDFIPGQRTWDNMHAKIKESMHMLVVLSEDFSRSHFAKQELYEADVAESTEDLNIIPLKIESCDVPAILKNKTYIDCENNDITEIHYKIIEAVIDNGQKTRLKEEDSGEAFSISTYQKPGFRLLPRYKLEFVAEMRDKILMKSKLTEEDLNEIENIAQKSFFMKNVNISDFFLRITCFLTILSLLLCLAVVMLMICTMLGRSRAESEANEFKIHLVIYITPVLMIILSFGFCFATSWENSCTLMMNAKDALQRQLWTFNRNWNTKDAVVLFQYEYSTNGDNRRTTATMKIILIKFSRCKDLFIRKCEQRDDFQKRRCEGESLDDYADRMFDRFLRSKKINLLDIPHSRQRGHRMLNDAACMCFLLREDLLNNI